MNWNRDAISYLELRKFYDTLQRRKDSTQWNQHMTSVAFNIRRIALRLGSEASFTLNVLCAASTMDISHRIHPTRRGSSSWITSTFAGVGKGSTQTFAGKVCVCADFPIRRR